MGLGWVDGGAVAVGIILRRRRLAGQTSLGGVPEAIEGQRSGLQLARFGAAAGGGQRELRHDAILRCSN